jgi:hypothetical protein
MMFLQMAALIAVRKEGQPPSEVLTKSISALALLNSAVVLVLRFFVLPKVDAEAAAVDTLYPRRQAMYITAFAFCEAVWLFGFVLSFSGAPLSTAITFFLIGLVLLLLCTPRRV